MKDFKVTAWILAGLVLGAIVGQGLYAYYAGEVPAGWILSFSLVGNTVFMGLLKMILVPLVMASVIVGVNAIGDPSKLGRVGGWTLVYYFSTMLIAVITGLILVSAIMPGDPHGDGSGMGLALIEQGEQAYAAQPEDNRVQVEQTGSAGLGGALLNLVSQLIPANPLGAAADFQLLPVIAFSIILGVALAAGGTATRPVVSFFEALLDAVMRLVDWILWLAPLGVFALVAWTVARIGLQSLLGPLSAYVGTVLGGLLLHGLVTLPLVLWLFTRANPWHFLKGMRPALLTALGTDSSSATLPVTIEAAEASGCSRRASRFVLPLGATINMDGTALYEAVAVVFLFQAYGISLGTIELMLIAITATLAAVGAAGIPSAGLVTMVIVVETVNTSLSGMPGSPALPLAAVGLILGIDRFLDMCRTVVNVWGDAIGARIITRLTPTSDEVAQPV
jgi:solute carrier family 1 (high affinity glutamate transporter) protein 1